MFPADAAARLPLQLTQEQCDEYTQVTHCVRDETIAMYEEYLESAPDAPAFPDRDWKLIKRKEHFKIYASRKKQHATAYPNGNRGLPVSDIHQSADWQPQCILGCVGTYVGTFEDAMYGTVTPTDKDMMMRSITTSDDFVGHETLCDIAVPTEDDPYTYTGLRWSARPPFLASMVKPRDMTYVQAGGFCTINNKRAGFYVCHSMENIPGVPEFTEHGFRRCRFSLSIIMRPTSATTIDVIATIAADGGGDLPRNTIDNALKKKLVWLRAAQSYAIMRDSMSTFAQPRRDTFMGTSVAVCPQCTRGMFVLQPLTLCHVCESSVCSRCMTTQKLVLGKTKAELTQVNVPTCKGCIVIAAQLHVRDLAIHDFVWPFDFDFVGSRQSTQTISTDVSRGFSFFGLRNSTAYLTSGADRSSHTASENSVLSA